MKRLKILLSVILTALLSLHIFSALAYTDVTAVLNDTAEYIRTNVPEPSFGATGGEWSVFALSRSGCSVPQKYYDDYYSRIEKYVKDCGGILHNRKYTEYSRLIITLTAIGKDPSDVAGYNLLMPLADYDKTLIQGINGPVWALIALDCGGYEIPLNPDAKTQATRDMYIDFILSRQLSDGGFALGSNIEQASAEPDITGMVIQALSRYQYRTDVKAATDKALKCLSDIQDNNGGYSSWATESSESCVQAIVALCEMGIPIDDPRFVKNGCTLIDNLMTYYVQGQGFLHTKADNDTSIMATEQCLYALAAAKRLENSESSLYSIESGKSTAPKSEINLTQIINAIIRITQLQVFGI